MSDKKPKIPEWEAVNYYDQNYVLASLIDKADSLLKFGTITARRELALRSAILLLSKLAKKFPGAAQTLTQENKA